MDVCALLAVDHREVLQLARLVERSGDLPCRLAAHRRLADALRCHTLAEESVVHMALSAVPGRRKPMLDEARVEHAHAECMIARATPPADEAGARRWRTEWALVLQALAEHIDAEEQDLFPELASHFDAGQRDALALRYVAARREAACQPLPVA